MTLPAVTITESDGALGVLPPSAGRILAIAGVASSGPVATPATFARVKDLIATFTSGPAVEAAAHAIDTYGRPVLFTRTAVAGGDSGAVSAVTATALGGSATVTIHASPIPNDDYEMILKIVAGGEVGTTGITYQLSYDGGRTYGSVTALGTDLDIEVPNAGTLTIDLEDEETVVAGATYSFRTTAPNFDSTTLGAALDAIANSAVNWELLLLAGPIVAATFDLLETKFAGMFAAGKYHGWIGNARMPNLAESEASYLTAVNTIFSSKATKFGSLYGASNKLISAVSGRQYKRPVAWPTGAREQSVSEEVNIADVNLGSLVGVSIRDANGNADEHDESINPGLDDARFGTLRTWDGLAGVYVTRPRLFSAEGSDFQLMPHRRVLNLAHAALRQYFIRRLNKPIRVDKTTGFILESEALEIEAGALSAMNSVLLAKPKASGTQFALSRTDNLLSTKTLTGTARVIPLAYPEFINLDVGFYNPALLVQAA